MPLAFLRTNLLVDSAQVPDPQRAHTKLKQRVEGAFPADTGSTGKLREVWTGELAGAVSPRDECGCSLVAPVAETARQPPQQVDLAVHFAQQQRTAVAGHLVGRETGFDTM